MRITEKIEELDYGKIKSFFDDRSAKYTEECPYTVTMYQDGHPELVKERNQKEIEKLKPMLTLNHRTRVLDAACGIGRWADAIHEEIEEYCGIDFSAELINIAKKRNRRKNFFFYEGEAAGIKKLLQENGKKKYNVLLLVGILLYVNDRELMDVLKQLESVCGEAAEICIREPVALQGRLTLKDFYSEELKSYYHAAYRSRQEIMHFLEKAFLEKGFSITDEGFLFGDDDVMNNRSETRQYYFILKRRPGCILQWN